MAADRTNSARAWLALSCTRDGTIVQILHDDLGVAHGEAPNARLVDIVDAGSARKAENLIATLASRECVVGWHLNVPAGETARSLYFAGAAGDESLLILAAPNAQSAAELFDDLADANASTSQALRALLHEQHAGLTSSLTHDNDLYEELSRLNNELINRERELARRSAALERISAEKSRVVAIAAHDLRNPLTVIASYADLLKMDDAIDPEKLLYIEEIGRSARFMMELVEEMLDASRLESGIVDLELQEIDLVHAAHHATTINRIRAERKEITLTFEAKTDHALIQADPVKLRQIINNLVVNAIKFSPSRTNVGICVRRGEDVASIEVRDHGIGIPREKLSMIFEPFKTIGRAGTAGEKSTGLGLAIVKQLAELHGANVHVESEVGRGSLFRVGFPLSRP